MTVEMCGAGGESMEWVSENDGILVTYRQSGRHTPCTRHRSARPKWHGGSGRSSHQPGLFRLRANPKCGALQGQDDALSARKLDGKRQNLGEILCNNLQATLTIY